MIRRPFTLLGAVVVELALLASALWFAGWLGVEWPRMKVDSATYGWMALGIVPSVVGIPWSLNTRWPPAVELRDNALAIWHDAFSGSSALELALVALLAGFCEEVAFRGVLQPLLIGELGLAGGVFLCSLAFGLLHPVSRAYVVAATLMGGWLGVLTYVSGDCVAAIQVHTVHDWLALKALEREAAQR